MSPAGSSPCWCRTISGSPRAMSCSASMTGRTASRSRNQKRCWRQRGTSGVAARSTYDQVQNALQTAQHKVTSTQSDAGNILAQLGGNANIPTDQHPTVQRAQASLEKAELDLSYAQIRAPENGI